MVDTSAKIAQVMMLIEEGAYFTINRPRQYGKTTMMFLLNKNLKKNKDYFCIKMSFEGIGSESYKNFETFIDAFLLRLKHTFALHNHTLILDFINQNAQITNLSQLSSLLTELILKLNKKVVLLIDEVDKSCNNQLFLDLLGMLREKYLLRNEGEDITFQSVVLAGVYDVKTLKLKLRSDEEHKYNSPWNIAVDFTVDLAFSAQEITSMLQSFMQDRQIKMNVFEIAELLHYYTSGYPFLVSKLCYIIDAYLKPANEWATADVEKAVKHILKENNTNFDSLIKNLENNHELYDLVHRIALAGEVIPYVVSDPVISMGTIFGVLKTDVDICKLHNRIYEQYIYNHMTARVIRNRSVNKIGDYNFYGKR